MVVTGKTDTSYIRDGLRDYAARIGNYAPFDVTEIPGLKNTTALSQAEWKKREGALIARQIFPGDFVVLLDEKGREMSTREFSAWLGQRFNQGLKNLVFLAGGPFGFDEAVKSRADFRLSLSRMTFPHQLVRVIFTEQLYRALTILRNESYHHD